MLLKDIIRQINRLISNNSSYNLNFEKLEFYINIAIDQINEVLNTCFPTPREYFDSNAVDEIISYSDNYLGVYEDITVLDSVEDGQIYYKTSNPINNSCQLQSHCKEPSEPVEMSNSGYYVRRDGVWVLVSDIADIDDIVSFSNINLNNYVNDFDFKGLPDKYIRKCVVYLAAANYLEEEDELENQYSVFKARAEESLQYWKQTEFSSFLTIVPKQKPVSLEKVVSKYIEDNFQDGNSMRF